MSGKVRLDIKEITIIIIAILLMVFAWIVFKPNPIDGGRLVIDSEIIRLTKENDSIKRTILVLGNRIKKNESKVDSLESLKPLIKKKYEAVYKKIDSSNAVELTNQFNDVFSGAGIK